MRGRLKKATLDAIFTAIENGASVVKACEAEAVSRGKFLRMLDADATLADRYARARAVGMDRMAEEALAIADESPATVAFRDREGNILDIRLDSGYVAWQRNRIDARKWFLSKLAPKKYGDKLTVGGDPDNPIPPMIVIGPYGSKTED